MLVYRYEETSHAGNIVINMGLSTLQFSVVFICSIKYLSLVTFTLEMSYSEFIRQLVPAEVPPE